MKQLLSSIFSSERVWPARLPSGWLWSIVLTIAIVGLAELAASVLTAPLNPNMSEYWSAEAAQKYEWYRHMAMNGETPRVVAIGDSVSARNFDPKTFSAAADGLASYNLGWPGMYPLALDAVVPRLLREGGSPDYVLLMQSPLSFRDTEQVRFNESGVLSSPVARRSRGRVLAGDRLALARVYSARRNLLSYWLRGATELEAPSALGFMPLVRAPQWESQEPIWNDFSLPELDESRLEVTLRLIQQARQRGFSLIAVVPPMSVEPRPPVMATYRNWIQAQADENSDVLSVWDFTDSDLLPADLFKDHIHLWREGAQLFSEALGVRLSQHVSQRER